MRRLGVLCLELGVPQDTVAVISSVFLALLEHLTDKTGPWCIRIIPLQWITTSDPARATAFSAGGFGSIPPTRD